MLLARDELYVDERGVGKMQRSFVGGSSWVQKATEGEGGSKKAEKLRTKEFGVPERNCCNKNTS